MGLHSHTSLGKKDTETEIDAAKGRSMSLTGWLSLKEDEDVSVCVSACPGVCIYSPVHVHSHDSLILSLSVPNGAAGGTALYYLSGPVNSEAITHSECPRVCGFADVKALERYLRVHLCLRVWAIVCNHCHALPHVNITRKGDIRNRLANYVLQTRRHVTVYCTWCVTAPLMPTMCHRFLEPPRRAPHVHSKRNETLHSFPRLSPPLVS